LSRDGRRRNSPPGNTRAEGFFVRGTQALIGAEKPRTEARIRKTAVKAVFYWQPRLNRRKPGALSSEAERACLHAAHSRYAGIRM